MPIKFLFILLILTIIFIFRQIKLYVRNNNFNSNKVDLVNEDIKRGLLCKIFAKNSTSDVLEKAHKLSKLSDKEKIHGLAVSRPLKDTGLWKVILFTEHKIFIDGKKEKMYVLFEISDLELFDINKPEDLDHSNIEINDDGVITAESLAILIDNSYLIKSSELEPAST